MSELFKEIHTIPKHIDIQHFGVSHFYAKLLLLFSNPRSKLNSVPKIGP